MTTAAHPAPRDTCHQADCPTRVLANARSVLNSELDDYDKVKTLLAYLDAEAP